MPIIVRMIIASPTSPIAERSVETPPEPAWKSLLEASAVPSPNAPLNMVLMLSIKLQQ